jgi:hypothetical protein
MPIIFACTSCGSGQRAGEHLIGRTLRCQVCSKPMTVPAASMAAMPAPVPRSQPTPALVVNSPPAAAPADEPMDDDDIFFEQIRKTSRKGSKKDRV